MNGWLLVLLEAAIAACAVAIISLFWWAVFRIGDRRASNKRPGEESVLDLQESTNTQRKGSTK